MSTNYQSRYGDAGFADEAMRRRAGLYRAGGLYIGHDEHGRPCYSEGQAGVVIEAAARGGKNNFIVPWLIDGSYADHLIVLDWKLQLGCVAQLQVLQGRRVVNFNPRKARGVPAHRINPLSYISAKSPDLIPRAKSFSASWIGLSGSPQAEFFERMAQSITEAVLVTYTRLKGGEPDLPGLADLMAQMGSTTPEWLMFEAHMLNSPEEFIKKVARDLAEVRAQGRDTGGYTGIKNEIAKAFAPLSDPRIREAVSPPYDFCFSELTRDGAPPYMVNIMEAADFATTSAPIIKALFTAAQVWKREAIGARRQLWLLDEIGILNSGWSMFTELFSFGPGYGVRPVAITQELGMLDRLVPKASETVPQNAGTAIHFALRGLPQAFAMHRKLGTLTLEYDNVPEQSRARHAYNEAVAGVMLNGDDPFEAMRSVQHQQLIAGHKAKQPRALRLPEEVMNEPKGRAFVFMPGVLERPFYATVPDYWTRRGLAGRYLPDPYHPLPGGRVSIRTWLGQRQRRVITEPVPAVYESWQQYRDSREWSYIEGYRPTPGR